MHIYIYTSIDHDCKYMYTCIYAYMFLYVEIYVCGRARYKPHYHMVVVSTVNKKYRQVVARYQE